MSDDFKPDTIWRLQTKLDIQGLVKALQHNDAAIRKRAAAALRATNARDAVPALRRALEREIDADARASIALAIEALTSPSETSELPQVAPASANARLTELVAQLQSKTPEEVIAAARELGGLGDKMAVEPLVILFRNANVSMQIRLAVAEALLKLESAPVEVALLANLRNQEWEIRRKAAAILGQLQAAWAVQPLAKALHDPHPIVRKTARAALKHIGTRDARQALYNYEKQRRDAAGAAPDESDGLLKRMRGDGSDDIPTTPRPPRGLLKRMRGDEEDASQAPTRPHIHLDPTQPLDPKVLDEIDRKRAARKPPDAE